MRLSDFAPRINGTIPPGVRGLGVTSLSDLISQDLLSWVNYPGGGGTPDQFAATLAQEAQGYCANWPDQCAGVDINSLVSAAVAQYAAWYSGHAIQSPLPNYTTAPPPGYQYNPYTGQLEPIPNALTATAPTTTQGPTQSETQAQTSSNVLSPPTPKPIVTQQQIQNAQIQGGSQATANGTSGSNTAASTSTNAFLDWLTNPISSSVPIPMWAVLAGGLVAVLVLMKD